MMRLRPLLLFLSLHVDSSSTEGQPRVPTLHHTLTIGCDACSDGRQLAAVLDVDVGKAGEVLVVDADAPMLRLFDRGGRLLWSGGRKGAGPGEFRLPVRARLLDDGSIVVVDMTLQRITVLAPDRTVRATVPTGTFTGVATIAADGTVLIGSDDFAGTLQVLRWRGGSPLQHVGALVLSTRANDGTIVFPALALSNKRTIAAVTSPDYAIVRMNEQLVPQDTLRRTVARVRRTAAEQEELDDRLASRGSLLGAAENAQAGARASGARGGGPARTLKSHFVIDALRFDEQVRLWVHTQRGNESSTVFDLFSPAGTFAGTITLPHRVRAWTVANGKVAAAVESSDGVPQVTVWEIRN